MLLWCSEDANIYILNSIASKIRFHMLLRELVSWGRSLTLEALLFSSWSRKSQTNLHIIRKRSSASMLALPTPHFSADSPSSSHLTMLRASRGRAARKKYILRLSVFLMREMLVSDKKHQEIWPKIWPKFVGPGKMVFESCDLSNMISAQSASFCTVNSI